eukprot:2722880-Rhodomonas_salina.1
MQSQVVQAINAAYAQFLQQQQMLALQAAYLPGSQNYPQQQLHFLLPQPHPNSQLQQLNPQQFFALLPPSPQVVSNRGNDPAASGNLSSFPPADGAADLPTDPSEANGMIHRGASRSRCEHDKPRA